MLPTYRSSKLNPITTEYYLSFIAFYYFSATNSTAKIAIFLFDTALWINQLISIF